MNNESSKMDDLSFPLQKHQVNSTKQETEELSPLQLFLPNNKLIIDYCSKYRNKYLYDMKYDVLYIDGVMTVKEYHEINNIYKDNPKALDIIKEFFENGQVLYLQNNKWYFHGELIPHKIKNAIVNGDLSDKTLNEIYSSIKGKKYRKQKTIGGSELKKYLLKNKNTHRYLYDAHQYIYDNIICSLNTFQHLTRSLSKENPNSNSEIETDTYYELKALDIAVDGFKHACTKYCTDQKKFRDNFLKGIGKKWHSRYSQQKN